VEKIDMTTAAEAHASMRSLPFGDAASITAGEQVMILAPHPDDEVLGCAGLILESLRNGLAPFIVIVTDGSGSHPNSERFTSTTIKHLRADEAREAVGRLGLPQSRLHFLECRDTAAPHQGPDFDRAVKTIAGLAAKSGCGVIAAPWQMDPHSDHLAVHKMAAEVARSEGLRHLSYPVWGWTLPADQELGQLQISGSRLEITHLMERKQNALQAHATQLGGVIHDDPTGFVLTEQILAKFLQPFEVYLDNT
jgi:LmbE family N-acetylglucosaminyl deacetylase